MSGATLLQSNKSSYVVELNDARYNYIFGSYSNHIISPDKAKLLEEATKEVEQSSQSFTNFASLLEDLDHD